MAQKKQALGRGLGALLQDSGSDITPDTFVGDVKMQGGIHELDVSSIDVNPFQPRKHFDRDALIELAESIKIHGLIQPITVRKIDEGRYQLISGERRFRASQAAGMTSIAAYVRVADDQAMLEMAIVENIQRENLDPIEVAIGYQRLIEECDLTQEQLSQKVSKSRSNITNYLRLLKLPPEVQLALREGKIDMGHARAIINLPDPNMQLGLLEKMIAESLSVRDVESLVRSESGGGKRNIVPPNLSFDEKLKYNKACLAVQQKIDIKKSKSGKGKVVIPFSTSEEFDRILDRLIGD